MFAPPRAPNTLPCATPALPQPSRNPANAYFGGAGKAGSRHKLPWSWPQKAALSLAWSWEAQEVAVNVHCRSTAAPRCPTEVTADVHSTLHRSHSQCSVNVQSTLQSTFQLALRRCWQGQHFGVFKHAKQQLLMLENSKMLPLPASSQR